MIQFVVGIILGGVFGAILGVVADRLWSSFEQRPRLDIVFDVFQSINGDGYRFTVTNQGIGEIPPCVIDIYHPRRGSTKLFMRNKNGGQSPGQKIDYEYVMLKDGRLVHGVIDFYRMRFDIQMNEHWKDKFVFRLVLDNSDKIIYENKKLGNTFAEVFQNAREAKNVLGVGLSDWEALQVKYQPLYKKLLGKVVTRRIGKAPDLST
jgi:hypothetical protein